MHSPTPWRVVHGPARGLVILDAGGEAIAATLDPARQRSEADAKLIVDAVNAHGDAAALREALAANEKAYRETMAQWRRAADERDLLRDNCDHLRGIVQRLADNLRRYHINGERDTALLHEARAALAESEAIK